MKVKEYFQTFVDAEFDKFLPIILDGKEYNIAISRDKVPVIENVDFGENRIIINFSNEFEYPNIDFRKEVDVLKNLDDKIIRVTIPKLEFIDNGKEKGKISRILNKEILIKSNNSLDKDFTIKKNIRKRLYLALNNIVQNADKDKILLTGA